MDRRYFVLSPEFLWLLVFKVFPARLVVPVTRLRGALRYAMHSRRVKNRAVRAFEAVRDVTQAPLDPPALAREYFVTYSLRRNAASLIRWAPKRVVHKVAHVSGIEHVDAALAKNAGVIVAMAHIGHGAAAAAWLVRRGNRVLTVRRHALRRFEGRPQAKVAFFGSEPMFMDWEEAPVTVLKQSLVALKENAVVTYVGDGMYGGHVTPARLFGREVSFRTGMAELARISKAPMVPAFTSVDAAGIHITYHDPIEINTTDDVAAFAQHFADLYAQAVVASPASLSWQTFQRQLFSGAMKIDESGDE